MYRLLTPAPIDRSWHLSGMLVMCRASLVTVNRKLDESHIADGTVTVEIKMR